MKPERSQQEVLTYAILMARDAPPTDEHAVLTIAVSRDCSYTEALRELDALIKDGYLETTPEEVELFSGGRLHPTSLVMLRAGQRSRCERVEHRAARWDFA